MDQKLEFFESEGNEEFKKNVCIPYFRDIYKVLIMTYSQDLSSRSDEKAKGINKISMLEVTWINSINLVLQSARAAWGKILHGAGFERGRVFRQQRICDWFAEDFFNYF